MKVNGKLNKRANILKEKGRKLKLNLSCTYMLMQYSQILSGCNWEKNGKNRERERERDASRKDIRIRGAINIVPFWHALRMLSQKKLEQGLNIEFCFQVLNTLLLLLLLWWWDTALRYDTMDNFGLRKEEEEEGGGKGLCVLQWWKGLLCLLVQPWLSVIVHLPMHRLNTKEKRERKIER